MKLKYFLLIVYILILFIPALSLITNTNISSEFENSTSTLYFLQRLFGLYAITFLFLQILLGAFMIPLRRIYSYPTLLNFHITQGIITYGVVLFHPLFYFLLALQQKSFFQALQLFQPNLSTSYNQYESLGKAGLYLLTIGVCAGLLRKNKYLTKHWRKLHIFNYFAFIAVIFHSWFIGSDTHSQPFVFLYILFSLGVLVAIFYRRIYKDILKK